MDRGRWQVERGGSSEAGEGAFGEASRRTCTHRLWRGRRENRLLFFDALRGGGPPPSALTQRGGRVGRRRSKTLLPLPESRNATVNPSIEAHPRPRLSDFRDPSASPHGRRKPLDPRDHRKTMVSGVTCPVRLHLRLRLGREPGLRMRRRKGCHRRGANWTGGGAVRSQGPGENKYSARPP